MTRAVYKWGRRDGVVWIIDKDEGRSVTNDVERVIADLTQLGVDPDAQPIIYCDSMGRWDQIATRRGRFAGFVALAAATFADALARLKDRGWSPGQTQR